MAELVLLLLGNSKSVSPQHSLCTSLVLTEVYLFKYAVLTFNSFLFPPGSDAQTEHPDQVEAPPWDGDPSLGSVQEWKGDESWKVVVLAGPAETRLECVVS